jgi:signal transduction histidine kinase/DNA-binding response OmpR family regulator/purine-cytosine permease-like protein
MRATQNIFRVRRQYNKWVGNQTLEDYALRFTATRSRRWSIDRVAKTALGATAFMALEAIAAAVTLQYGFANTLWAMLTVALVIFVTGLPISYYAARYGLDIDLLTRSAGFGYLGSTITSLIYASFTFIFFAIEAAILASALHAVLGIPVAIGYILSALAVIPIVTHGITAISKFQIGTQNFWLLLQLATLVAAFGYEIARVPDWTDYAPAALPGSGSFNLALFGAATSILFAMVAQIGEQVDYLRFMPEKTAENSRSWWFWLLLAGPGWIFTGLIKMLLGSFLAFIAISQHASFEQATDPVYMYQLAFNHLTHSPAASLLLAGVMVVISQMKINVTNAYAGSIAWSNFFSRLTHSHPGRVVWLVFNVVIALLLMELGIYRALESILGIFAIVAISWLASLAADLMINKPLGLSPANGEFKRAHLYDVNPVGTGSMIIASIAGILSYLGHFGEAAASLAHFISLGLCFVLVPLIAALTKSKYYLARQSPELLAADPGLQSRQCCICETVFEMPDMSYCPAYQGPICSLCCSLDARCHDSCKTEARFAQQALHLCNRFLPANAIAMIDSRVGHFLGIFVTINLLTAGLLSLVYFHMTPANEIQTEMLQKTIWTLFFTLMIVFGVISWLFLLARESREVAQQESSRQTRRLIEEIEAHQVTYQSLQEAKDLAERSNNAKSRYLTGISHELRSPLQAILGYAQLLLLRNDVSPECLKGLRIMRRNGEYLTDLIEGLLDISKIEAGRLDIYRSKLRFAELIEQMVDMFSRQAAAKNIGFRYIRPDHLPEQVIGDEKRLRQILINLLSNAVKYTVEGQIELQISYRNQVAEIAVRDTGVGIHSKDITRILDPFERVRNERVPNVSGTGLGLTIVKLLTEVMGGDLQIESTPGKGSCFRVSLLLSRDDSAEEPQLAQRRISGYQGPALTVVVVDDEPVHRGLLSDLLVPRGFITLEAKDAASCLDIIRHTRADLFLLDVSMQDISGIELAGMLREQGITAPIIMISADAQARYHTPDASFSHNAYLVKPISTQVLMQTISTLLNIEWRYASEAAPQLAELEPDHGRRSTDKAVGTIPDHRLMRELLSYAENGFYKGVKTTLADIRVSGLLSKGQLDNIEYLTEEFRFAQLATLLQTGPVNDA